MDGRGLGERKSRLQDQLHGALGDNKAYLVRNSIAQVGKEKEKLSLLVIAWDPKAARSSRGASTPRGAWASPWHLAGDTQWMLHAEGVHTDGSPTSATQIISLEGKDSVKTSSVDRVIGGVVAPDIDEIVMKRKPPAVPGTGAVQPPVPQDKEQARFIRIIPRCTRLVLGVTTAIALGLTVATAHAQRGRGGGGRPGGGVSRPMGGASRPSGGGMRPPAGGMSRPCASPRATGPRC